jgi:amino acid transporter
VDDRLAHHCASRQEAAMDIVLTLMLAGGLLAVTVFCGWRGAKPYDPKRGPRMIPWSLLMMLFAAGLLLIVVHLISLLRLNSGG